MGKRIEDVLGPGLAPPFPKPDPPEKAERAVERYVQELERESVEAEMARPVRSARSTLKQRVDESADALAAHAVSEALSTSGDKAVKSVKTLLDVADGPEPLKLPSASEIESMSYAELTIAMRTFMPREYEEITGKSAVTEAGT